MNSSGLSSHLSNVTRLKKRNIPGTEACEDEDESELGVLGGYMHASCS